MSRDGFDTAAITDADDSSIAHEETGDPFDWPSDWAAAGGVDGVCVKLGFGDGEIEWPSDQLPEIFLSLYAEPGKGLPARLLIFAPRS